MKPEFIYFEKIGEPDVGYINVAEVSKNVPFEIRRVYWVYDTPLHVERGNHAHKKSEQVIICLKGAIEVILEDPEGKEFRFILSKPDMALYIPPMHWRKVRIIEDAVFLCLASSYFNEEDYIRDYKDFK